ncbi:hypothetical protein ILFOPFJJ_05833 [Ensifer psoraleae]|uniref:hypothetical protein n=1 Tax=Sinorhizobium psoraleae TaxID=520838 RepID=UPI0015688F43|nr:hypothetical protein [Sinorhizobium psoraleae]NRP74910.1 hypothetical protein [Sinorhizobium psoraleae]
MPSLNRLSSIRPILLSADDVELSFETFAGLLGAGYAIYEDSAERRDIAAGVGVWSVESEL